nr:DUF1232 domain-containing protein [Alkalibacter mobilis]
MLKDKEVSKLSKGVLIFAIVYFFLPFDFIPEAVFPGLGHFDDLLVLLAVLDNLSSIFSRYRTKDAKSEKYIPDEKVDYSVKDENQ